MLGVLVLVLSTVYLPTVSSSDELVGRRFDAILEIDGTALDPEEYLHRREIFTEKCKRMTEDPTYPCPKANSNYMYTGVELDMMNGVKRAENVPDSYMVGGGDEQLYKRQDGVEVPTSYDVRDDVPVRVVGQGTCGNCYIQAVMGALEIAYYKQTGKEVRFSAQEFTECFYAGCRGGDPRFAMTYLADLDRLAQESDYGEYLVRSGGKEGTCKAATTPDSLLGMRVLGYKSITVEELPYYVYTHGAVVTCLAWSGEASGARADCKVSEYEGGIYDDVEIKDGCDHAVLIIGYTPDYWIVKNSHGKSWGEDGYIRMKRGKNVCGMEQELNVLMTEVRKGKKEGIDPATRCPIERPNYCEETHTCTSKKTCKKPAPEKRSVHNGAIENNPLLHERDCVDTSPVCSIVDGKDDVLCTSMGIALVCSKSCDTCDMEIVPPVRTNSPEQATGPCVRPSIANGKVSQVKLNAGDKFSVTCKPGYMRLGPETMECVIQEVYKPDTRLLPKCVPESRMSEKYVDNGATYSGMRNTSALGRECLNWMDSWNRGISGFAYFIHMALENRENWAREMNHNYCRNTGGKESAPFCIVEIMGNYKLEFCFEHPSCDKCKGAVDKYGDQYCMENTAWERCPYGEFRKRYQADWYWDGCLESCCAATGC